MTYDSIIAGAGFAGAVTARVLAEAGRRVLVLEQRPHVGGNAFDCLDESGILIHQYGPHIFHTNDKTVFDFLSRFTVWRTYEHEVVANLPAENGRMELPVPFNLASLRLAFGPERSAQLQEKLISAYGAGTKVTILQLREATDPMLGINLDPSHMMVLGADPIAAARALKGCIFHVHGKDARIERGLADTDGLLEPRPVTESADRVWNYVAVGCGKDLQWWKEFFSVCHMMGYDGDVSLEMEDLTMTVDAGVNTSIDALRQTISQ